MKNMTTGGCSSETYSHPINMIINTNPSKYQTGVHYSGIKLVNNLPPNIKSLVNEKKCEISDSHGASMKMVPVVQYPRRLSSL
jgi:hypothetical protein